MREDLPGFDHRGTVFLHEWIAPGTDCHVRFSPFNQKAHTGSHPVGAGNWNKAGTCCTHWLSQPSAGRLVSAKECLVLQKNCAASPCCFPIGFGFSLFRMV